jgi:hypothetical protein
MEEVTLMHLYFGMLVSGGFSSLEIGMRQLSPIWSSSCHCEISSRPFSVLGLEHGCTVVIGLCERHGRIELKFVV